MNKKIVLVEDDLELCELTKEYLIQFGFEVITEHLGQNAVKCVQEHRPDLVILDVMLPDLDGIEVCKAIRPQFSGPIIMLSARTESVDQVIALEIGADEYLCKPIDPRLLAAKVKAHIRREERSSTSDLKEQHIITFSDLEINNLARSVKSKDKVVSLSAVEFDLLWYLAKHPSEIKSRDEIFSHLNGSEYNGQSRAVDIHISQIRSKLFQVSNYSHWIKTVRGHGYIFNDKMA